MQEFVAPNSNEYYHPQIGKVQFGGNTGIKFLFFYAQSLRANGKLSELQSLLHEFPHLDRVIVVITWLTINTVQGYNIPGFCDFHSVRSMGTGNGKTNRRGGISIFMKGNWQVNSPVFNMSDIEYSWVISRKGSLNINIIAV